MKSKKYITPVLMLLLLVLFALILYLNFAFGYFSAKIDAVNSESEYLKIKRMEIELAIHSEDQLKAEIAANREKLQELSELYLLDSSMVADDILSRMKELGIELEYLNVEAPQFAGDEHYGGTALLYSPIQFQFSGSYNNAVSLLKGMEESRSGAYKVVVFHAEKISETRYTFIVELQLYYFDDPSEVPVIEEETGDDEW